MIKTKRKSNLARATIYSISSQMLSLAISLLMGFILPKYIDEVQYAYKQIFALYIGYLGVLHFGLIDGIMLRYAQYDYNELDKPRMRSQFLFLLGLTSVICVVCCGVSVFFLEGVTKQIVILVAIGAISKNIFTYASYVCQSTNQISKYAILVIAQRVTYAAIVILLLCLRVNNFLWYCIAELCGDAVGILCGMCFTRKLYFGRTLPVGTALREAWSNISAGIFLMVANFSSILLVGGAKMVIQWRWDELVFGKAAYSFTLTSLFLTFVSAISVVLFPSMKRMKQEELPSLYGKLNNLVSPVLFAVLLGYFPLYWILLQWLPAYSTSLAYLGVLLPMIVFTSKVSLLTDNYLKAYRREKLMLLINAVVIALGFGSFLLCAYGFSNMEALLYCVVVFTMIRSFVSELAVMKIIGKVRPLGFIAEFLMTLAFLGAAQIPHLGGGALAYLAATALYLLLYRKSIKEIFSRLLARVRKSPAVPVASAPVEEDTSADEADTPTTPNDTPREEDT